MNKVIDTILNRHSYRGTYRPDPVPEEDLKILLEAGLAAPSGCNKQTVSLIAVNDPEYSLRTGNKDVTVLFRAI